MVTVLDDPDYNTTALGVASDVRLKLVSADTSLSRALQGGRRSTYRRSRSCLARLLPTSPLAIKYVREKKKLCSPALSSLCALLASLLHFLAKATELAELSFKASRTGIDAAAAAAAA